MTRFAPLLLVLALSGGGAAAQAPRITPAGDPSVDADTIYRLAVDPARHAGEDFVYLLDDGVLRFEADGRSTRTYRQVIHVLTKAGAERWGEQNFGYSADREKLTINWIRVLSPDGTVLAEGPTHEQESLAPVALEAPVYSDSKIRRVTIGGIAPNTLLDFSWTTEQFKPVLPGDFYSGWRVTTGRLVRRSRFVVDVPELLAPRLKEQNWRLPRPTTSRGGRVTYTWAASDVPPVDGEPYAATPNDVYIGITVAGRIGWSDIARWYHDLSRDRYALTPELERLLAQTVAGARTLDDSLRAVHRWVAQDFRYVSLSLGIGGYRPRTPAAVLQTQYGDCKDKATLFIALARRMGVRAYPVLLAAGGGVDRTLPSISQFDHMIAALVLPDGGYRFVDLTSELTPWGELPPSEQGEFAVIVHSDGRGEEVMLPLDSTSANRTDIQIVGELSAQGVFQGRYTETRTGTEQYGLRGAFTRALTPAESVQLGRALANGVFEGAQGDSVESFDGRDLTATPRVAVSLRSTRAVQSAGGTHILTLPLRAYAAPGLVSDLETRGPRRYPIDIAAVIGPVEETSELRLRLPAGWRARLPRDVAATSDFGAYSAEYRQDGRELRVTRRMVGRRGTAPPERIDALVAWLREVARDDVRYLVLEAPN
jgi:transglutaminase-like putative cysteine protease